jgi:excisionase family DNA binding protein
MHRQNPATVAAFSIRETMARTGIGRNRLYQLIREGRLTGRKFGTKTLIVASDLQRVLDDLPAMPSMRDPATQQPPL